MRFLFALFRHVLVPIWFLPMTWAQSTIYFDETPSDRVILGNVSYEIALRKTNGGILYLLDKTFGGRVSSGSRNECLWGSLYRYPGPTPDYVGGCSHSSVWNARFSYSWNSATNILTLNYKHDTAATRYVDAVVTITPSG